MQILIKIALISLFPLLSWSQISFYKLFSNNGYDFGQGVIQLSDSSYILTGSSSSFDDQKASQAFLMKMDSLGNFIWSHHYGGNESDWGRRVLYDEHNSLYVSGYTNSIGNGGFDFYLFKTDLLGNLSWEKTYGGTGWEKVNDAIVLPDTSIIMVGETTTNTIGNKDVYLVKTNKNGDTLWTKQFGTSGEDFATSIRMLNDSICVIGGQIYNEDSLMNKALLLKLNVNGQIEWQKEYGKHGNYIIKDLCLVGDHIDAVGSKIDNITGKIDPIITKIYLNGNEDYLFEFLYQGENYYELITPYRQLDKVYVAINSKNPGITYNDGLDLSLGKFTETLLFDNVSLNVSSVGDDIGGQLIPTNDGGVFMVGYNTNYGAGGNNVFVLKIGENDVFPNTATTTPIVSDLVQIVELENESISFYPNPSNDKIYIDLPQNWQGQIKIIDLIGNELVNTTNSNEIEINHLKAGNYLIQFISKNGSSVTKKIVVL